MKTLLPDDKYELKLKGAYLELTEKCNFHCQYCYNSSEIQKAEILDEKTVKTVLDEISKTDFPGVVFSGGEPFLHPSVYELIDYSIKCGVKPTVITNASLLDSETLKELLDKPLTLQLTFDGAKAETHGITRGRENYHHIINILKLAKERDRTDKLNIRFNISRFNYTEVENMIKILSSYGINKAIFAFLHRSGRGFDYDGALDRKDDCELIYKIITEYRKLKEKYQNAFEFDFGELDKAFGCAYFASGALDFIPRIAPNGDVFPCQIFMGKENSLGNIYDFEKAPLLQIASSARCHDVIDKIRSRKDSIRPKCLKCPLGEYCLGGCPATAFNLNGDISLNGEQCYFLKYSFKQNIKSEHGLDVKNV